MCRLEEQGCAEVAEAGGGGCCAAALLLLVQFQMQHREQAGSEGQTARALNLTSGERAAAAEHFLCLGEGVSHWREGVGC